MDEHEIFMPERGLWASVLTLAIKDAFDRRGAASDEARNFILDNGRWFNQVCDMAGINPRWIQMKVKQAIKNPKKAQIIFEIGKSLDKRK